MADGTTVKTFSSEAEACLAQGQLEVAGIKATVQRFSRYRAIAGGGYILRVSPRDIGRARAIMKEFGGEVDMDEYVSSDDTSYRRCPECDSVNVKTAPLSGRMFWVCLLCLGLPLLFLARDHACGKCGHVWRE